MTRYAILLSTEEYANFHKTPFCHADAIFLEKTLVEGCDYAKQHVLSRQLSLRETMSPKAILDEIEASVKEATDGDTILFFYAGHGHLHGTDTFLLLPDTEKGRWEQTALPLRDISQRLRAKGRTNIRIFDACHSGLDVRNGECNLNPSGFSRALLEEQEGWITLASCTETESSYSDSANGNGIFTRALCEAILDFPPGVIYPESLKIRVVDKVLRRASEIGVRQTPVMNASIQGNVSIANRTTPPQAPSSGAPLASNLVSRAEALRIFPRLGGPEHKARLNGYINKIYEYLESKKEHLGFSSKVSSPQSANRIPDEFRQSIVLEVAGIGTPNHVISQETEEIFDSGSAIETIMGTARKRPTGRYRAIFRVQQYSDWPDSWCTLELNGDGYLPSFLAGFYLVPFQLKALLICIVASKGVSDSAARNWTVQAVTKDVITLDQEATPALAEGHARAGLTAFEDAVTKLTNQRLSNLEQELMTKKS